MFTNGFTSEMMIGHIVQDQDGFIDVFKSFGYRARTQGEIQRLFWQNNVHRKTIVRRQTRPSEMNDTVGGHVLGGGFIDTTAADKN